MSFISISNLTKQFSETSLPAVNDISFSIGKGEIVSLLGPSGCGKTTALRMIAGFENPTQGLIKVGNQLVVSDSAVMPPEKRGIGMVFQEHALFPHMSVAKNIMYGLKHMRKSEKLKKVNEMLELVELSDFADAIPANLSGGQQQRVAIARALAPSPHVILLDEPFSSIDAGLREKMRQDISMILKKADATAIIVTHDQKDAFAVADKVVVMNNGMIQQISTPKELYRCPVNCFVAQFVGKTNLIQGTIDHQAEYVSTALGKHPILSGVYEPQSRVMLSIRPETIEVNAKGAYKGMVDRIVYGGDTQEIHLTVNGEGNQSRTPMIITAPINHDILVGEPIRFSIEQEAITIIEH